jgi:hypothetical protein
MSFPPKTDRAATVIAAACLCGVLLSACSDPGLYLDRRDSIAFGAGDAVAANAAMQTINPWPRESGNPQLTANGQRMQSAVERYRNDNVTPPVDPMMLQVANPTSSTPSNSSPQNSSSAATTTAGGTSASSAAGGSGGQ